MMLYNENSFRLHFDPCSKVDKRELKAPSYFLSNILLRSNPDIQAGPPCKNIKYNNIVKDA